MNKNLDFAGVSMPRKLCLGAAVVLLINSFLPWYNISFGGLGGVSANGWHGAGVLAWLLVIVLLAVEGARIAGVLPLDDARAELASLAAACGAAAFGLLFVIVRLSDGHLGIGFYIGLITLLALTFGAFLLYRSGTAVTALKNLATSSGEQDAG